MRRCNSSVGLQRLESKLAGAEPNLVGLLGETAGVPRGFDVVTVRNDAKLEIEAAALDERAREGCQ